MTKYLTLTFDNGPCLETTPQVLKILEAKEVKASFFMIGNRLTNSKAQSLAKNVHSAGHFIGNHTWSHSVPLGQLKSDEAAEHEIRSTQELIDTIGQNRRLFRPKGNGGVLGNHLLNPRARDVLMEDGYTLVLWNSIPRDWEDPEGWVETALDHCEKHDWTVMVLHDISTGAMEHLNRFIDEAHGRGIIFVQDIPLECTPIIEGRVVLPVSQYVSKA